MKKIPVFPYFLLPKLQGKKGVIDADNIIGTNKGKEDRRRRREKEFESHFIGDEERKKILGSLKPGVEENLSEEEEEEGFISGESGEEEEDDETEEEEDDLPVDVGEAFGMGTSNDDDEKPILRRSKQVKACSCS